MAGLWAGLADLALLPGPRAGYGAGVRVGGVARGAAHVGVAVVTMKRPVGVPPAYCYVPPYVQDARPQNRGC